jgi:hypothetical protein
MGLKEVKMGFRVHLVYLSAMLVLTVASSAQSSASRPSAPPGSFSSSARHATKPTAAQNSRIDPGTITAGFYRNRTFAFSCKIPPGWVLRTDELNAPPDVDEKQVNETEVNQKRASSSPANATASRVLLAAFSRPPQARGEDVNSSILIAAESASTYAELKEAAQYLGPVAEVAKAQGFAMIEEPYEGEIGAKTVARADFQKDIGSRVMRQSTLVILAQGYLLSFTFIGGTEDEVEELIDGLNFTASAKPQSH